MSEPSKQIAKAAECIVRAPRAEDFARMGELAGQLGYPSTAAQVQERLGEIRNSPDYAVFVAELPDGTIAGWIGLFVFRSVELDKCAEISGLIVDEKARSAGIGKVLLDMAEAWARGVGCGAIAVHSNINRQRAHGFYRRHGYAWVKTQEFLRKNLAS